MPRKDNSHPSRSIVFCEDYSAPVAQLDRVPGYEPGGREFDKFAGSEFRMRLRLRSEPGGALHAGVHVIVKSRSDSG